MKQVVQQYGQKREEGQIRFDRVVWLRPGEPLLNRRGNVIFCYQRRDRHKGGAFGQSPSQKAYNEKLRETGQWRGKTK